jgi:hypothetical protein
VTPTHGPLHQAKPLWLSAWPFWALLAFASLAAVRLLPGGYPRAVVAVPILLLVPGALTLCAVFSKRDRPQGMVFVCLAALLSVIWSAFVSLALYVLKVLITADSTYWGLLIVCAVLAIAAEARLLAGQPVTGRRAARNPVTPASGLPGAEPNDAGTRTAVRGAAYSVAAAVAGISLLAGGAYSWEHLHHPAPAGYTSMAWTGPQVKGVIALGSAGTKLPFKIVHRQPDAATFKLQAAWGGNSGRLIAKPMTLSIGPEQTFHSALSVPPISNGCTYRIVVTLTAVRQIDSLTQKPPTWSINMDVRQLGKPLKTCK